MYFLWLSTFRYTVFATHMDSLAELATIYPNVKVLHFYVDIRDNRLDFKVLSVFLSYEFETLGTAAECYIVLISFNCEMEPYMFHIMAFY